MDYYRPGVFNKSAGQTAQSNANMKRGGLRAPESAKPLRQALIASTWLFLALLNVSAEPLDQWYRRNPLPEANRLTSVTYGSNSFVAVGAGGAIVSSGDGTNWVSQISGTSEDFRGVAYGNGTFVAVGGFGEIFASLGLNWTNADSGSTALLPVTISAPCTTVVEEPARQEHSTPSSSIHIEFPGRALISVESGADAALLRSILESLRK